MTPVVFLTYCHESSFKVILTSRYPGQSRFSTTCCCPFFTSETFSVGSRTSSIMSPIPLISRCSSRAFFTFFREWKDLYNVPLMHVFTPFIHFIINQRIKRMAITNPFKTSVGSTKSMKINRHPEKERCPYHNFSVGFEFFADWSS